MTPEQMIERLDKLMEHQRQTRGDYVDYGHPDAILVDAKAMIAQLTAEVSRLTKAILQEREDHGQRYAEAMTECNRYDLENVRLTAERDALTEQSLFFKRQWHQEDKTCRAARDDLQAYMKRDDDERAAAFTAGAMAMREEAKLMAGYSIIIAERIAAIDPTTLTEARDAG